MFSAAESWGDSKPSYIIMAKSAVLKDPELR
jgi:hypothetical protein